MGMNDKRRLAILAVASGAAIVGLLLITMTLGQETVLSTPLGIVHTATVANDPAVVTVNGRPIGVNEWVETVRVDQVMNVLAGQPAPSPEETLDRLVNGLLVDEFVSLQQPAEDEVEVQIAAYEAAWGVSDEQVVAALAGAGLEREALLRAVSRALALQQAQSTLQANGTAVDGWLAERREQAEIVYDAERMAVALRSLAQMGIVSTAPLPGVTPAEQSIVAPDMSSPDTPPTSPPVLATLALSSAPDFTLPRAGGGTFNLAEQLTQGPVVLVFFQRCG